MRDVSTGDGFVSGLRVRVREIEGDRFIWCWHIVDDLLLQEHHVSLALFDFVQPREDHQLVS